MSEITKVSISVEINGKPYLVDLPEDRKIILINMASGFSDNGKLNVIALPENLKFTTVGEL